MSLVQQLKLKFDQRLDNIMFMFLSRSKLINIFLNYLIAFYNNDRNNNY